MEAIFFNATSIGKESPSEDCYEHACEASQIHHVDSIEKSFTCICGCCWHMDFTLGIVICLYVSVVVELSIAMTAFAKDNLSVF